MGRLDLVDSTDTPYLAPLHERRSRSRTLNAAIGAGAAVLILALVASKNEKPNSKINRLPSTTTTQPTTTTGVTFLGDAVVGENGTALTCYLFKEDVPPLRPDDVVTHEFNAQGEPAICVTG